MSGAQWSPERLTLLANRVGDSPWPEDREAATALRAFARVVSVLERKLTAVAVTWSGSVWIATCEYWEGSPSYLASGSARADTPLAAILALADALDAGRGDA